MKTIINLNKTAVLSVDNTRTFEDKSLDELYVTGGEIAAQESKRVINNVKKFGSLIVNVFESHPEGHISFASSYKNKNNYEWVTLAEVESRTEENNGLSESAMFTLEEVKEHLRTCEDNKQRLWPDHSRSGHNSVELMAPLTNDDFDITIIKGQEAGKEAYSGFDGTRLDEILKDSEIETLILIGVATDYCVWKTAVDARTKGYNVLIISDAVAGVGPDTTKTKTNEMKLAGINFITSDELNDILQVSLTY